ncbi:hypothetical protein PVAND_005423 [Polypedilum vanderplanki]|uniref:N-terminal Ras-GEF domain-containing protein n=1 Tax=Polypedilum vanderplanki TaxID=319348 RepID=A0A9J6C0E4_POLVA|nr:hypothetical protein PVAND_005423 [Polypedilum vanderplanki]
MFAIHPKPKITWIGKSGMLHYQEHDHLNGLYILGAFKPPSEIKPNDEDCDKRADEAGGVVTVRCDGIVLDANGAIINGPLDAFVNLLIPVNVTEVDNNFIFTFLLSSRTFIQPHELLEKLIESVPENDESLERLVVLMKEWTRWFPYDFRGEEIMSLVKHIVARCSGNKQLSDTMSDLLSALLIKLTDLSAHEDEMKSYKRPLAEPIIVWPNSSKLAQLLCHVEKKFAKHIGPEEFMQCSPNLIKEEQQQPSISNYDVPQSLFTTFNNNNDLNTATTSLASSFIVNTTTTVQQQQQDVQSKKKTCNLENYVEWSNRLRLLVANEIMQCTNEYERSNKIELWSSVAQHCLLVGNYNSATSILEPICRLQAMWKKILSATNQQQIDCLMKHIEHSQNLNLWSRQTEKKSTSSVNFKKPKRIQIITPNSSSPSLPLTTPHIHLEQTDSTPSIIKSQPSSKKLEWVVLPVFVDIVKLALKAREDCSTRLPNGSLNFIAFNKLSAIVSAFTMHMSNVPISAVNCEEHNIVNHIFTCPLVSENDLYVEFARKATKIESYYDVP